MLKLLTFFFIVSTLFIRAYGNTTPESCTQAYATATPASSCTAADPTVLTLLECSEMYRGHTTPEAPAQVAAFYQKAVSIMSASVYNLAYQPLPAISDFCAQTEVNKYLDEIAYCMKMDLSDDSAVAHLIDRLDRIPEEIAYLFMEQKLSLNHGYQCLSQVNTDQIFTEMRCIELGNDPVHADLQEAAEKFFTKIAEHSLTRPIPENKEQRCGEYLKCFEEFIGWDMIFDEIQADVKDKYDEVKKTCAMKYTITMSYFSKELVTAQVKWENVSIKFAHKEEDINIFNIEDIINGSIDTDSIEVPYQLNQNGSPIPYEDRIKVAMTTDEYDRPTFVYTRWIGGGSFESCWPITADDALNTFDMTQKTTSLLPTVFTNFSFDMNCGVRGEDFIQMNVDAYAYGDHATDFLGTSFYYPRLTSDIVEKLLKNKSATINLTNKRKAKLTIKFTPEGN